MRTNMVQYLGFKFGTPSVYCTSYGKAVLGLFHL